MLCGNRYDVRIASHCKCAYHECGAISLLPKETISNKAMMGVIVITFTTVHLHCSMTYSIANIAIDSISVDLSWIDFYF